mmetsp:Transcript_42970/g.68071  ORF Transcript_42970/g.68071 Transcript_42970/m.68071 type:complete len:232 (-) Transcript_42970:549-1244(-)
MIALTAPQRLKSAQSRSPIGSPDFSEIHINGQVVSESVCDLLQSFPKLSCEVRIDLDVHMVCLFTLHNTATSRVFCPLLPALIGPFRKMPVKDFVVLFLHVCTYGRLCLDPFLCLWSELIQLLPVLPGMLSPNGQQGTLEAMETHFNGILVHDLIRCPHFQGASAYFASTLVELVDRRVPNLKERHRVVSQPLSARVCEERMLCSTPFQHHHEDGLNAQLAACSLGHLDGH